MPMNNNDYGDFFDSYSRRATENTPPPHPAPKKHKRHLRGWVKITIAIIAIALTAVIVSVSVSNCKGDSNSSAISSTQSSTPNNTTEHLPETTASLAVVTAKTANIYNEIDSKYAVLVDVSNNTVLAQKNADEIMYPASLTKIMTLLVAAENVSDITATFKMTSEIIDPLYRENAAMAGFSPGEEVKIVDMFYGSMLKSGAEATVGLAVHIAGSEEKFVEMMNQKAKSLGLKNTHFTNTTGLHSKEHYTTCREFAVILTTAMKNDFCKQLLTTEFYTVEANQYHDELKFHSTAMSRMYGTEPEVATILGGKTGFTSNSGNCLATVGITDDGRDIVSVTAAAEGTYKPIYDAIYLYKEHTH